MPPICPVPAASTDPAFPRALDRARAIGPARNVAGWQDLGAMAERIKFGETVETPNAIAIALLGRQKLDVGSDRLRGRLRGDE